MAVVNARALINRAVVSVADGEKLGMISDVLVDFNARRIAGFVMGGGGLLHKEPTQVVPFEHVQGIAAYAITVSDRSSALASQAVGATMASKLDEVKHRVLTQGGDIIGDGDDVIFDDASGALTGLQLASKGGFLGVGGETRIIPIAQVISFGRDVITVQTAPAA